MLTYQRKRHEDGARDFAVFDGDAYLGDVIPIFLVHGKPHRKHEDIGPLHEPRGWMAHPAGESHPLCGNDDPQYVRLEFDTRLDAAQALRLRRMGWNAAQIAGIEKPPEVIDQ